MAIKEFFQTINWKATLQTALIRTIVASILFSIGMAITGNVGDLGEFFILIAGWFALLLALVLIAIPIAGLSNAGVPFIGLLALPAWLVVIADPVVWILHRSRPEWVPVDKYRMINPPVLAVFNSSPESEE